MKDSNTSVYLPGLNGIRAIAALAVVASHIILHIHEFGLESLVTYWPDGGIRTLDLGAYGVSMFFALSGFLITFLLLKESETGKINVRKFYIRRILRIWPLYYGYLLVCILVYLFSQFQFTPGFIYYIFFTANVPLIIGGTIPLVVHYWSLGVEEQFYLFWPWVNKLKVKNLKRFTMLGIFLIIGVKLVVHFSITGSLLERAISISRFQCMLIGGFGAILFYENHKLFLRLATHPLTQIVSWGAIFLVSINKYHIASVIDQEIITGITTLIIIGQVKGKGLIRLENKLLDFLGKISYGIYVIHPLVIFFFPMFLRPFTEYVLFNYIIVFLTVTGATILISYLSYRFFESPFLRLKTNRYTVVKSVNSGFSGKEKI